MQKDVTKDDEIKRQLHDELVKQNSQSPIKQDVYQPNGKSKQEIHSFYDVQHGAAGKIQMLNKATLQCAKTSKRFLNNLNELRGNSTYSNLNLADDKLEHHRKSSQKGLRSDKWSRHRRNTQIASGSSNEGRAFGYPIHFVSENYHIAEQTKDRQSGIALVPNRPIEDQMRYF